MKFSALRSYIKSKNLQKPYSIQNRELVIDADSYFKDSYKNSGCSFIFGPDCNIYSDYLASKLGPFLDCNIKCYFIFKGTTNCSKDVRQKKHKKTIDNRINMDKEYPMYFDPLLVSDMQKQTLEALGINYFCCEYDSMDAIVGVARQYKCPVLTDNVEYCLFGVSCILPNSIVYKEYNKVLECVMYEHNTCKSAFCLYNKMPILLTLLNDNANFLDNLPNFSHCVENCDVASVIRWIKRQRDDEVVSKIFNDENIKQSFIDLHQKMKKIYLYPSSNLGVKYFLRSRPYGLFKDDKKWLAKGVSNGRIAIPYIDIKRKGFISGSTVVNNVRKPDALLAAAKIIAYSHSLLTNSRSSTFSFIGRKETSCSVWEIDTYWENEIHNRDIFNKHKKSKTSSVNHFQLFFKESLSKYDLVSSVKYTRLPEECHILVITLVYYIHNVNKHFIDGAYFILLSYLMLGPISRSLYKLKENEKSISDSEKIDYEDCQKMYNGLKFLFRKVDLQQNYNTDVLHSLAEFQHCLQHMNYLNKLCGSSIPCTMYHDTYNGTFVYNTYKKMKNKEHLMSYLESNYNELSPFKLYKDIIAGFEKCCNPSADLKSLFDFDNTKLKPCFLLLKDLIDEIGIN